MTERPIPLHSFAADDATSIAFKANPLKEISRYDATIPHRHNYYELFFFVRGAGSHMIDFEEFGLCAGAVHFVSPGQVHQLRREAGTHGHVVIFSRDFFYMNSADKHLLFSLPFLNNSPRPVLFLQPDDFGEIFSLQQQIEKEFAADDPAKFDIIRSYLHILLLKCNRAYEALAPGEQEAAQPNALLHSFRMLVERDFAARHFVKNYAAELAVSEKHLNDTVKQGLGKTAGEYIHDRIILEAKRLLAHGNMSSKEVAHALHFDDPAHFSKFFKNRTGLTPLDFRTAFSSPSSPS